MTGDTGDTEDSGETRGTGETGLTELTKLTGLTGLNTGLTGRVVKCHGYDGYIRVRKLARSGKIFGRTKNKILIEDSGPCKRFDILQLC